VERGDHHSNEPVSPAIHLEVVHASLKLHLEFGNGATEGGKQRVDAGAKSNILQTKQKASSYGG